MHDTNTAETTTRNDWEQALRAFLARPATPRTGSTAAVTVTRRRTPPRRCTKA